MPKIKHKHRPLLCQQSKLTHKTPDRPPWDMQNVLCILPLETGKETLDALKNTIPSCLL